MRPGNREHVSHVAMHTPQTPLHLGRPSRVQRYSSSMHRAMEEDSWVIRHDDEHPYCCVNNIVLTLFLKQSKFDVRICSLNLFHSHGAA